MPSSATSCRTPTPFTRFRSSAADALGLTISLPTEDKFLKTRSALLDEMAALGGRAAEEIVFDEVTTGAA